jgi:hypothetical protein
VRGYAVPNIKRAPDEQPRIRGSLDCPRGFERLNGRTFRILATGCASVVWDGLIVFRRVGQRGEASALGFVASARAREKKPDGHATPFAPKVSPAARRVVPSDGPNQDSASARAELSEGD